MCTRARRTVLTRRGYAQIGPAMHARAQAHWLRLFGTALLADEGGKSSVCTSVMLCLIQPAHTSSQAGA